MASTGSNRPIESAGRTDDTQALSAEMAELRRELARISSTIGDIAANRYSAVREQASGLAEDVAHRSAALRDEAFARAGALEEELQRTVRDRPLTAVAVAAGVGYLVGLLSRSHR
jgi:ElaB/YqjD/DUF883 family membrane-anchored ribosome-binding protein